MAFGGNPIAEAFVVVRPDTKGFERETKSSISGVAKAAAATFAAVGVARFAGSAIAAGRESNKIAAQTAAVLKSTGGQAGITAKQVDALANSLARKTGIDDENIASTENLLLTFTNLQNKVGEGNDIFNQTTAIALDMSKALGQDTKASAIQLGKALNDPIQGVTALRRVGVSFTAQQLEQIKAMQQSGNLLGAQKIVLAELTKEFGGSAAAQATSADKLKVAFGNLQESIGKALIPVLDKVATVMNSVLTIFQGAPGPVRALIAVTAALAVGLGAVAIVTNFVKTSTVLKTAAELASAVATKTMTAAQWLLNAALTANPIGLVVVAIAALVAGIIIAYKHSETFRRIVDSAWQSLQRIWDVIVKVGQVVFDLGKKFVEFNAKFTPVGIVLSHIPEILGAIRDAFGWVIDKVKLLIDWLKKLPGVIDKALGPLDEILGKITKLGGGSVGKAVKGAVGNVLAIPFFAEGGLVPGPAGVPTLAVVHGGERVLTPAQQRSGAVAGASWSPTINQHFYGYHDPVVAQRESVAELRVAQFLTGVA